MCYNLLPRYGIQQPHWRLVLQLLLKLERRLPRNGLTSISVNIVLKH
jgi:hypothetical protein